MDENRTQLEIEPDRMTARVRVAAGEPFEAAALAARGNVTTLLVCQGESSGDILDGVRIVREPVRTAFERAEPASIVRMRILASPLEN